MFSSDGILLQSDDVTTDRFHKTARIRGGSTLPSTGLDRRKRQSTMTTKNKKQMKNVNNMQSSTTVCTRCTAFLLRVKLFWSMIRTVATTLGTLYTVQYYMPYSTVPLYSSTIHSNSCITTHGKCNRSLRRIGISEALSPLSRT